MGMASPGGLSAGVARGVVEMDISQLIAAANHARQLGMAFERALNGVNAPAQRAQNSINSLGQDMLRLAGIASGVAFARQFAQFAIQADATATAYRRQSIAAVELAGSQGKLNDLLDEYAKVTGNQIDKAQSLADVTKLQAIGFADTTAELNEFVSSARGASLALGKSQEYIIGQLQLAIANQSKLRLDQIGLGVEEVETRIKALRAANGQLTTSMAYQNAVLGLLNEKYGVLTTSTAAQATGAERAAKAWKDLSLSFGNLVGPSVDQVSSKLAALFNLISSGFDRSSAAIQDFGKWLQWLGTVTLPESVRTQGRDFMASMGYSLAPTAPRTIGGPSRSERNRPVAGMGGPSFNDTQTDAIRQWATSVQAIERDAATQRLDATRQYESQRAETISDYGKSIAREEADFAKSRARSLADYAKQVADAREDAARREVDAARDYARAVANIHEDAGKRDAKWQSDYSERIAELRADSNERLIELDADYAKARERAELDHRDRLMGAAARLDAVGVFEEQRNYARQQKDAADNHDEQRTKIQKALDEQLADALKAQQERLEESRAADAERLQDMQAAFEEQRAEARAADADRLRDMQEDFERRLAQEDEDRQIQNQRRAEDHAAQMAQMATAQAERMAQIDEQVAREKKSLEEKFLTELEAEGLHNKNWLTVQDLRQKESLKLFDEFWKELNKRWAIQGPKTEAQTPAPAFPSSFAAGGWVQRSGMAMVHQGEWVANRQTAAAMAGGMIRNISIGDIYVQALPGMSEDALVVAVRRELMAALEEAA